MRVWAVCIRQCISLCISESVGSVQVKDSPQRDKIDRHLTVGDRVLLYCGGGLLVRNGVLQAQREMACTRAPGCACVDCTQSVEAMEREGVLTAPSVVLRRFLLPVPLMSKHQSAEPVS